MSLCVSEEQGELEGESPLADLEGSRGQSAHQVHNHWNMDALHKFKSRREWRLWHVGQTMNSMCHINANEAHKSTNK